MRPRFCTFVLCLLVLFIFTTGCTASLAKPTVIINSPPHGSQYHEGDEISFQSTATDSSGIVRVELLVNGAPVRTDPSPNPKGQPTFTLVQTWKATQQGTHTISIRAYNVANVVSDPVGISITVGAANTAPTIAPTATLVIAPPAATVASTATSTPKPAATSSTVGNCTNAAAFVADVTVPDGTVLALGQAFNKIWRLRNSGSCAWGDGYQFVFVSGAAMGTTTTIPVPNTAPGATADLLVALTAPSAPGVYVGQWRLKGPNGSLFGVTVNVTINSVDTGAPSAPPAVPTTPVPPPPSGCTGTPTVSTFNASPTSFLTSGGTTTLSWGAVTNADSVEIDNGIGGIATPGSTNFTVNATTTFTLTAHCGANTASRQVTVTVAKLMPLTLVPIKPPLYILFQVTNVSVSVTKSCLFWPHKFTVTGNITTNSSGDVKYQWEGDGGGASQTLHFNSASTQSISTSVFQNGALQTTLHVTNPNDKSTSVSTSCP